VSDGTAGHDGTPGHPDPPGAAERAVAARVIDTLLRERYGGLPARVRPGDRGPVLELPVLELPGSAGGPGPLLALERDGFLADFRLARTASGAPVAALDLDTVDAVVAAVSDPRDADGVADFAAECRQALASARLRERYHPAARARLARQRQARPRSRGGPRGLLGYEALAAVRPHPAYPTSESRLGLSDADARRYAPEFAPRFELRWVAVPRARITAAGALARLDGQAGGRPDGWPTLAAVGLPEALADSHELLPVHPVTAAGQLARALTEAGLGNDAGEGAAVLAPAAALPVIPTLSTRTVALAGQPGTHLKLPLPTSTLGRLNRRSLGPGTLADGALVRGLLATAREGDPRLSGLLLADEGSYAHAGHPFLGYLLRRLPAGLGQDRVVPVAALLAPSLDANGGLVIEELAGWAGNGDLADFFAGYLRVLFGLQVHLFARYGVALESHQQNAALVAAPGRLRLLVKDFDGALVHLPRLAAALGPDAPPPAAFTDQRLLTGSDDALADVFITITLHLCAGALAFELARGGAAPLPDLLALIRRELTAALDSQAGWPAAALLRARVLDADRLPGKSMITAGTLMAKSRTGASDINKFYGTDGPNYLKDISMRSCR
jgi:siderophore synthetase component